MILDLFKLLIEPDIPTTSETTIFRNNELNNNVMKTDIGLDTKV